MVSIANSIEFIHWVILAMCTLLAVLASYYINLHRKPIKRIRLALATLSIALVLSLHLPTVSAALSTPIYSWNSIEVEESNKDNTVSQIVIEHVGKVLLGLLDR
jgi:uncharacterized membrane protein